MASKYGSVVKDACRRFPNLPVRAIARFLMATHGELFDQDYEIARSAVRRALGKHGEHNRSSGDKALYRNTSATMPITWAKKRKAYRLPEGSWLVLADVHVPFHEVKPIEAAIQYGQSENVGGILLNGDIQDCASVGMWPQSHRDFNGEIEKTLDFLDLLRGEFPNAPIVYKPGNHEYRLPRLFVAKMPELAESPLAAMETLLGFEERGIEFLDYHQIVMAGMLPVLHGHEFRTLHTAVNPARGLFLKAKTFAMCAHCHRTSEHSEMSLAGVNMTTWSVGCLCNLSPDYLPYGNNWNWGFAIVHVGKSGDFEVENKRVLPSGKVR